MLNFDDIAHAMLPSKVLDIYQELGKHLFNEGIEWKEKEKERRGVKTRRGKKRKKGRRIRRERKGREEEMEENQLRNLKKPLEYGKAGIHRSVRIFKKSVCTN